MEIYRVISFAILVYLIGEVSKVNDDRVDNHFYNVPGRFPKIEEDEEPLYLMQMDYSDIKVDW